MTGACLSGVMKYALYSMHPLLCHSKPSEINRVRPIEIVILVVCFASLLGRSVIARERFARAGSAVVIVLALLAHLIFEGWRYAMLPAYLLTILTLCVGLSGIELSRRIGRIWVAGGSMLLLLAVATSWALPANTLLEPTGRFGVGVTTLPPGQFLNVAAKKVIDAAHPLPLVQIWYPAAGGSVGPGFSIHVKRLTGLGRVVEPVKVIAAIPDAPLANSAAPFPVLVYFSGWPGTENQNLVLIRELVSHGFVVASLIYPAKLPGMAETAYQEQIANLRLPLDFSTDAAARRTIQLMEDRVRTRAADAASALDVLTQINASDPSGRFTNHLNLNHAGAMGFSLGGAVAAQAGWLDQRLRAVVNLDGWLWDEVQQEGLDRPFLTFGDLSDPHDPVSFTPTEPDPRFKETIDQKDFRLLLTNYARHGGILVLVSGTAHANFSDAALHSPLHRLTGAGPINARRAAELINAYVLAFFDEELNGRDSPLLYGNSARFPEALVKVWQRKNAIDAPRAAP
jgi:dienelactone hydrolase